MNRKVILTDCDGVLLDWEYAFDQWMRRHEFMPTQEPIAAAYKMVERYEDVCEKDMNRLIRMFNESAAMRKLPPMRDAIKYVRKLHQEHGYIFHCITSMSTDTYAQHLRKKNLCEMFGPSVFEDYIFLDCGADKDEVLEKYRDTGCWWVEDKPQNADVGLEVGLRSILLEHDFSRDYSGGAFVAPDWKTIYKKIVSG